MDTFRILMVLPSVFTRGWDHFGRKIGPPGGVPKPPFWGPGGTPPPPPPDPRGGYPPLPPVWGAPPGGGARHPPGGGNPPPPGGGNPGPKGPPPGVPHFGNQIRERNYERGSAL